MTLEELADLLRTPLPGPPQLTDEQLARLKASAQSAVGGLAGLLPSLPQGALPMMPEWLRRYAEERGLLPGQVEGPGRPLGSRVPQQWQPVSGTNLEQLDPVSVQHYNELVGR